MTTPRTSWRISTSTRSPRGFRGAWASSAYLECSPSAPSNTRPSRLRGCTVVVKLSLYLAMRRCASGKLRGRGSAKRRAGSFTLSFGTMERRWSGLDICINWLGCRCWRGRGGYRRCWARERGGRMIISRSIRSLGRGIQSMLLRRMGGMCLEEKRRIARGLSESHLRRFIY